MRQTVIHRELHRAVVDIMTAVYMSMKVIQIVCRLGLRITVNLGIHKDMRVRITEQPRMIRQKR